MVGLSSDHPPAAARPRPCRLPPGTRRRDVGGRQGTGNATGQGSKRRRAQPAASGERIHTPHGLVRLMCRARAPCQPGPRPRAAPAPTVPDHAVQARPSVRVRAAGGVPGRGTPGVQGAARGRSAKSWRTCTGTQHVVLSPCLVLEKFFQKAGVPVLVPSM